MEWASILVFAVALSLDGFGAGISYGMRKIKIPFSSLLVICFISVGAMTIAILSGHLITRVVSPQIAQVVGAVILIAIGSWNIFRTLTAKPQPESQNPTGDKPGGEHENEELLQSEEIELLKIKLWPLGLVIHIIREPHKADIDQSGVICGREAFLLGVALSMDALVAGIGAALAGLRFIITPVIVGVTQFALVAAGDFIGRRWAARWISDKAATIPGLVLIGIGILRVIKL